MTHTVFKIAAVSLAGIALSGCTIPDFGIEQGVKLQEPAAPTVAAPAVKAPAAKAPTKPRWAHQPIGGTVNDSDGDSSGGGGGSPSDGDEDSGWG